MTKTNSQTFIFEKDSLENITGVLKNEGLILYPTDTVWAIGCDATNTESIKRIFNLKQRNANKPFILLVNSIEMLRNYVEHIHPKIETLLDYHTRPLTVIYDQAKNLPPAAYSQDGSIAIRIVQDNFCKDLISTFGKPIIAAKANVSGEVFPSNFGGISSDIIQGVDHVVHPHRVDKATNEPSVVVKYDGDGGLLFLRE